MRKIIIMLALVSCNNKDKALIIVPKDSVTIRIVERGIKEHDTLVSGGGLANGTIMYADTSYVGITTIGKYICDTVYIHDTIYRNKEVNINRNRDIYIDQR